MRILSIDCPVCGSASEVLSTRRGKHAVLRRRVCKDDPTHPRFTTAEVPATAGHIHAVRQSIRNVRAQAKRQASKEANAQK